MDGNVMINENEIEQVQVSEEQMDVTEYMFTKNGKGSSTELNTSNGNCDKLFYGTIYNPFFEQNSPKKHPVEENSTMSRIGPFADNRPICDCNMVKQMTANPDVRYLLSLLPDMAEMNTVQKSVFKTRVLTLLHKTLMVES